MLKPILYVAITFMLVCLVLIFSGYMHLVNSGTETYSLESFEYWTDSDSNCQDTRTEVLLSVADLPIVGIKPYTYNRRALLSPDGCSVEALQFTDPYSGKVYSGLASNVGVDHLVPLSNAWESGASEWTVAKRTEFANWKLNLVPTLRSIDRYKGDKDPSEWKPPNRQKWCWYARRWLLVKQAWGLSLHAGEVEGIHEMFSMCPAARQAVCDMSTRYSKSEDVPFGAVASLLDEIPPVGDWVACWPIN